MMCSKVLCYLVINCVLFVLSHSFTCPSHNLNANLSVDALDGIYKVSRIFCSETLGLYFVGETR